METNYLFVYGTLLEKFDHPRRSVLEQSANLAGLGYIHGILYQVSTYPGAVPSKNRDDKVYGELYELDNPDQVLNRLDFYEGYQPESSSKSLFVRRVTNVFLLDSDTKQAAWAYLYNKDTAGLPVIESGDYISYLKDR